MPNCTEHLDCDLVCSVCRGYYCRSDSHDAFHWIHERRQDMPDDREEYYNDRAERWYGKDYD